MKVNMERFWVMGLTWTIMLILLGLNHFFHLHILVVFSVSLAVIIWFIFRAMRSKG
jgi:hypothetical protein